VGSGVSQSIYRSIKKHGWNSRIWLDCGVMNASSTSTNNVVVSFTHCRILTTISTVILLFARNVGGRSGMGAGALPPFFASGTGVVVSVASIIWTWGNGARLSRRLVRRPTGKFEAANLLRRAVRVGVSLNLVGLFVNLVAAEQIVGNLAIKVLTSRGLGTQSAFLSTVEGLQPLDVSAMAIDYY
jgi:hypothetical protein